MHPGVRKRDGSVPGEQLEEVGVGLAKLPGSVAAENDASADDPPAPLQRYADDTTQRGPFVRREMTAGHLVEPGEPHRGPAGDDNARHSLGEREHPA